MKTPWFTPPAASAKAILFCFPFSGGSASAFREWTSAAPSSLAVVPVQLPGREARLMEKPFSDIHALNGAVLEVMRPYLDRPYALFGHSMGALIIFELARLIRRKGLPAPQHIFPSAFRSPEKPNPREDIHHLREKGFIDKLREYGGTPESVFQHEELLQLIMPMLQADFSVHETYRYYEEEPLDVPISIFAGLNDRVVPENHMDGWDKHTRASFKKRAVPGEHFYVGSARPLLMRGILADLGL
ncbi:MAG: thioesterase II family protein [Pseudomonadota bacterium]